MCGICFRGFLGWVSARPLLGAVKSPGVVARVGGTLTWSIGSVLDRLCDTLLGPEGTSIHRDCGGWPLVEVVVGPLSRRTARDRVPWVVWGGCGFAVSLVAGPSVL
jgi:hypothetical protein